MIPISLLQSLSRNPYRYTLEYSSVCVYVFNRVYELLTANPSGQDRLFTKTIAFSSTDISFQCNLRRLV